MPIQTDTDEDEDQPFDPNALTPPPELPPPSSSTPQWLTPREGEVWGDFRLGEMLGQGGMGMVFKAHQLSLNRTVALKVLTPYLGQSESFRARFLREAQSVARIASPHVVQVYAAGAHGDYQYFAMEFVEGEDLGGKLAQGYRPSRAETLDIVTQAARGLVAAGEHDIVHRDIKPGNMMITRKGVVKLMDFGLVRIASEERMTTTGVVMGTPYYFSPEQAQGMDCDQRADLYSLGIVFYELLTGELPFTGDANAVVYAHINTRPRKPRELDREIPQDWQEVLLTCLAKKPEARYRNASELLRDLERLAGEQAPALVAPPRNPWPARAAAVAAIVAAASVSAYAWRPQKPVKTARGAAPTAPMAAAATTPMPMARAEPAAAAAPAAEPTKPRRTPRIARPTVEPKLPPEPPTAAAPCETSITVRAPFIAGDFVAYRWTLEGAADARGRLDAATTVSDENTWTAPGKLGATPTLTVIGIRPDGAEVPSTLRLASTAVQFTKGHLQPFARWATNAPAAGRLAQDARGRWWGADRGSRRLRVGDWLAESFATSADENARALPRTLRARGADMLALDAATPSLLAFDAHGQPLPAVPIPSAAPLDVAPTADGLLIVADAERGLLAIDADGKAFPFATGRFTRIAIADDGRIAALDDSGARIQEFDAELQPAGSGIPVKGADRAVDLAFHRGELIVLLASGAATILPADGAVRRIEPPTLFTPKGSAGALAIGAGGEALVTWPQDGAITRLAHGGWTPAVRGGIARQGSALAADACGRVWTIADDAVICRDAQGWAIARVDATEVGIQRPEQLAVSSDGTRLAIAGPRAVALVDLTQAKPHARELTAPGNAHWLGTPQVATDEHHRVYVLDREQRRVVVIDEAGASMGFACGGMTEPWRFAVSPSGSMVYVAERDGSALVKYVFASAHDAIERQARVTLAELDGKRADAVGCDSQGQIYLLDEGRTLRVCSWKVEPPIAVSPLPLADARVAEARALAVSPDGQVWICNPDGITGLRW